MPHRPLHLPFSILPLLLLTLLTAPAQSRPVTDFATQPDDWFATAEGKQILSNILSWQNDNGGWWKAYDATTPRPATLPAPNPNDPPGDDESVWHAASTIDNKATWTELRLLARAARIANDPRYKHSFSKGLRFLLSSQYPTGGFPQRFPLQNNYGRHITYNDGAMIGVLTLLRDIAHHHPDFAWLPETESTLAAQSLTKGVDCILNSQIKIAGHPTAWCQQHDPDTLLPTSARSYELPSISASESAGITSFLMSLPAPDARVIQSVDAAIAWFEKSKITGKRVETVKGPQYEKGSDKVLVDDPAAPPLWARFYDLETNAPFFANRDGKKLSDYSALTRERRVGYSWLGTWPQSPLTKYPKWKAKLTKSK